MALNPNGLPPLHQAEGVLPPEQSRELSAAIEAERLQRAAQAVVDAEEAALAALRAMREAR